MALHFALSKYAFVLNFVINFWEFFFEIPYDWSYQEKHAFSYFAQPNNYHLENNIIKFKKVIKN
jgi:hypothetical protein